MGLFDDEPKRKAIRVTVKREVYKRAKRECERCGTKLQMSEGDFHHFRKPSISPTAETVQFLCPTCHRKYGHERKTVRHSGLFNDEIETVIKRKRAPTRKKTTKKKATRKKRTIKKKSKKRKTPRKKPVKKKKTTRKKTTRKKRTTKKKTTKGKKKTTKRKTKSRKR